MSLRMIAENAEYPPAEREDSASHDYLVVLEPGETGWGAWVPDLPGVVAAADSEAEIRDLIAQAIQFHVEGLRADGEPVPSPASRGVRGIR